MIRLGSGCRIKISIVGGRFSRQSRVIVMIAADCSPFDRMVQTDPVVPLPIHNIGRLSKPTWLVVVRENCKDEMSVFTRRCYADSNR